MNLQEQIKKVLRETVNESKGWGNSKQKLEKTFKFKDFNESIDFVNKVAKIAETQNHHPDIKINYDKVKISITDHEKGGVSEKCHKLVKSVDDMGNEKLTESKLISLVKRILNESDPKVGTGKKPKDSDRRLYTDENPNDTVSVKFRTKQDIVDTLNKESFKSKSHARQSQIINLIHQRLRVALERAKDPEVKKRLRTAFEYIETKKETSKRKTKGMKEGVNLNEDKNSHLVEVFPNKYVYHTSNPGFRDKISKEGLRVKSKSVTWLSDTNINGKVIFAVNSDNKKDWWDSTYDDDIYKIDTTNLKSKWYSDPNFYLEDKRIITFEDIPLNSIKLIYKGTGLDPLEESINIENPQTDEYNDIFVDGEKVGYIILSPARKEYYWVDVNLPNPLAIVDIKILNQFRGKNYMKETMNWLYNFAKENGYKSLFLRVDDDSEISQETLFKIYQKYGFSVYKTTDDEDDIFMYKLL